MIDPSSTFVRVAVVAGSSLATLLVLSMTSHSTAQSTRPTTSAATAPAVPLVTGEYPADGLTFRYPQTWSLEPAKDGRGPMLYLQEPRGIACYWSVAARQVPSAETLEALVERVAQGMATIYRDVKVRDKGIITAPDGTRRGHVEYAYTSEDGAPGVHRQVLIPAGPGRIINATEACAAERWERDGATLRQITDSLRITAAPK